ncbi:MAG TPA: hypothetical protein VFP65_23810 [Anaeromyxobacteraceae bacterium]|nr:hypothetical protein [Anaeromyxobacteraceae bacterium]
MSDFRHTPRRLRRAPVQTWTPTTPIQAAARALREARAGKVLARVAVCAALGDAEDWPQAYRRTACECYGLTPDDPAAILEVQRRRYDAVSVRFTGRRVPGTRRVV